MKNLVCKVKVVVHNPETHRSIVYSGVEENAYWDVKKNQVKLPRIRIELPDHWKEDAK